MVTRKGIDPITLEIIRNALSTIIDQMALTMQRTSYSPLVRDLFDFGTGLCDAEGNAVAEGLVNPIHTGVFPFFVKVIREEWSDRIYPGDIFICNDPYEGASHIPDIYIVRPIFVDGKLTLFAGAIAHQVDMGGRIPGSNACDSTSIYQEGLRIPPLKYYERGERNFTLYRLIEKASRVPDMVLGDIEAEVAGTAIGEKEVLKLINKYGGWSIFRQYLDELLDYSERLTRAAIRELPDGEYEFEDFMDDDGFTPEPVRFHCKITVESDHITFDYTGSAPTVKGSINMPLSSTITMVNTCLRLLVDPSIPANSGVMRPMAVIAPYGTVVNAGFPAGVAGRGVTASRVFDVTLGALGKMLPDRMPACESSGGFAVCLGGTNRNGKPFVFTDFVVGSWGGRPFADGIDVHSPVRLNYSNTPCEVIERLYPISMQWYSLIPDTGGSGKYRGGLAVARDYRVEVDTVEVQWRQDRARFSPWGAQGGKPGALGRGYQIRPDGKMRELKKETFTAHKGDVLRMMLPGGGGWGDPYERDPERVLFDVREGKISIETARHDYGVIINEKTTAIDLDATEKLRSELRSADEKK